MKQRVTKTASGREITDDPEMQFFDISFETKRVYHYKEHDVTFVDQYAVHSTKSGAQIVIDKNNRAHYVPRGWTHLTWETAEDRPLVQFASTRPV